ncbi:ornithine carbamoyltransferase [Buchnera aphidicola]|uniref:Ornithine carbamoyltransferase n=1 Tax=Buchnera aphidicola (Stegophylla sp.) TaxID=2315800 RepID=A0A4D6Y8U9_9GAMM|nr:ornithine carbamoyltransferase [Buchnera aphidicola (Stegophylla sp.)]QCI26396.1 ornithine carbamoyltransferase [Buchnera aphidicola (Stegophylla sp.)]
MNCLYKKSFLKMSDLNQTEIKKVIDFAIFLKEQRNKKKERQYLKKKKIALIFEQQSTRTRCAFEIAIYEQGGYSSYLSPKNIHLGYKESILDTAKVLEKMYDGIQYRGCNHNNIKLLSKNIQIPVWNGLTEKYHPTQLLADLMTIQEYSPNKPINHIICAYVGDASNNIGNTILETAHIMNFELRLIAPKKYWPNKKLLNKYKSNNKITCTENIKEGVKKVDFIYTDVWISMGESDSVLNEKILALKAYQVNNQMLELTKNNHVQVLHCLPALHDNKTQIGNKISKLFNFHDGIEITNEVFQKYNKIIFQQAENRLHTIKSIMIKTMKNQLI